ncbi:MAG: hypothetical protein M1554_03345 [Patescibacteria group bacterium]|jgi:hypothetical protein|nr:hypothetical protein [Patescibacteria group bacterium]
MSNLRFQETTRALWNEESRTPNTFGGVHLSLEQCNNPAGLVITKETFSPDKHDLGMIDPLAVELIGIDQANIVLPNKKLFANSIIYSDDSGELPNFLAPVSAEKNRAMTNLLSILKRALSFSDNHQTFEISPKQSKIIPVADIDFIIGKYESFLDQADANLRILKHKKAINIIIAHSLDLELPPNVGTISLGRGAEINTNRRKEVDEFNKYLDEQKQSLLKEQQAKYGRVALIRTTNTEIGFDAKGVDRQIATLIKNGVVR